MPTSKNNYNNGITSNSFLETLMPQIKISQKRFLLDGIEPAPIHSHMEKQIKIIS